MKTPKISIIIPIYNIELYVGRCLDSLIHQSYKNIEIIVVDDGSVDASGRIADEYAKKDLRIKVLHQKNGGVSSARNTGINNATGEYIMFVDGDDKLALSACKECIASMKGDEALISFSASRVNSDEKGDVIEGRADGSVEYVTGSVAVMKRYLQQDNLRIWAQLFKRSTMGKLRFDTSMRIHEDALFMLQFLEKANSASIINTPFYFYISRPGSAMKSFERSDVDDVFKHYTQIGRSVVGRYPDLKDEAALHSMPTLFNLLTVAQQVGDGRSVKRARAEIRKTKRQLSSGYTLPLKYRVKLALSYSPVMLLNGALYIHRKLRKVL